MPNPVPWLSSRPTLPVGPLHLEGPYARFVRVCVRARLCVRTRCCVAGRCGLPDVTQGVACCSSDDCRGRVGAGHGAQFPPPPPPVRASQGAAVLGGARLRWEHERGPPPPLPSVPHPTPCPSCPWGLGKGRLSGVHISTPYANPGVHGRGQLSLPWLLCWSFPSGLCCKARAETPNSGWRGACWGSPVRGDSSAAPLSWGLGMQGGTAGYFP